LSLLVSVVIVVTLWLPLTPPQAIEECRKQEELAIKQKGQLADLNRQIEQAGGDQVDHFLVCCLVFTPLNSVAFFRSLLHYCNTSKPTVSTQASGAAKGAKSEEQAEKLLREVCGQYHCLCSLDDLLLC
jgi:hypothetical protein